ncbi:MAG: hypothetical protein Kow0077_00130 [Anaerolineae bacterium]
MDAERLGQQLRAAREARELRLEDVEQALRIRKKFLSAFETGAYEDLPGVVQARGFLRNYARYLRLDEDSIVAEFDAIQSALPPDRRVPLVSTSPATQTQTGPVVVPPPPADAALPTAPTGAPLRWRLILGVVVGLVVLMGMCYGGTRILEGLLTAQAQRSAPDLVEILPTVPSLTPSATFIPSATPLPGARLAAEATLIRDRVVIDVAIAQRTFLRVTVDGVVAFEGIVRPGAQLQYQAQQVLNLVASNAAGVDVIFNNLPLGVLGGRGEALDRTFTPDLVLTPTAVPTATPTATLPPSDTPAAGTDTLPGGEETLAPEAGSGKSGQGVPTPTPLPLPGQAQDVAGTLPVTSAPGEPSPLPALTEVVPVTPSATPTVTPSPTRTPTLTVTPSATLSPTPTAVLPPRITNTPIPEKQR